MWDCLLFATWKGWLYKIYFYVTKFFRRKYKFNKMFFLCVFCQWKLVFTQEQEMFVYRGMHTPENTLERGSHPPPPPYTAPARPCEDQEENRDDYYLTVSMPNVGDNFDNSMLYIENNLDQLDIQDGGGHPQVVGIKVPESQCNDSSPDASQTEFNVNKGWMNGIFGCLRPFLSAIGKGGVNEIKGTPDDWEIPFENISELSLLGAGGQGVVFYGKLNNEEVAVKKVQDVKETDIRNLRKLNHPNIIKFKGVCTQKPCYCIVMEYCPYGPLYNLLRNNSDCITPARVVDWSKQIAAGMQYLHAHKIIHRDLKSPNVLIGDERIIKISDFGTSRTWNEVSTKMSFGGTVAWMAPEAIKESPCSEKIDIWSFGVVLWELLTCEVPYKDMERSAIMYMVGMGKLKPPIPSTCPEGFKLLMNMCWNYNPKDRPSFKLISSHLEIAAAEILSQYKDEQFFKTQETWKVEIQSIITEFKMELQNKRRELQLKEEQLIKERESELRHLRDIRVYYDRRLAKVNQMYQQLTSVLTQLEHQPKDLRRRKIPFINRKVEKRKCVQSSTTPTSPDCLTSPDSPQIIPSKSSLCVKLNSSNKPESTTISHHSSTRSRKRQYSSTSSRVSTRSKGTSTAQMVDTETQTDLSENDFSVQVSPTSPTARKSFSQPQRVVLGMPENDGEENVNGNTSVQLHYMVQHDEPERPVFTNLYSRESTSDLDLDETDDVNRNAQPTRDYSDDDRLETIGRKVSAALIGVTNGNIVSDIRTSSDNGNITDGLDLDEVLRKRRCSDTRQIIDSAEDITNDSVTDEEGEDQYNYSLRRKSIARRPIYPGRKSARFKTILNTNTYSKESNASDEGNTSEYSNSPSSKSSTLESNPELARSISVHHHSKRTSGSSSSRYEASSDSESEDNVTIATQIDFSTSIVGRTENIKRRESECI
ncbi:mitogen-activated protein kinase kinase kinase 13-B isoform X2 [Onthophagus taurus]|uniref:mitogen-activated protein kinase kinase kinase 13-B isoform X2 n=1 Tax=Onthophagus taurus TaxID=166361 RepID=UPI000C20B7C3|nr:mitogen-activated protein kinase kinase kinase 13-B isoform X2 [Onthophagus taurus]